MNLSQTLRPQTIHENSLNCKALDLAKHYNTNFWVSLHSRSFENFKLLNLRT
jgi:hypothetical protein